MQQSALPAPPPFSLFILCLCSKMANSLSEELAKSMLVAAGSLQGLEYELDRLSLQRSPPSRHGSSRRSSRRSRSIADSPLSSSGSGKTPRRMSRSSSKYDSAIGSLPSQTDDTTTDEEIAPVSSKISRRHSTRVDKSSYQQTEWDWLYHTQVKRNPSEKSKKQSKVKRRESYRQPDIDQSACSSTASTPTPRSKHHHPYTMPQLPVIESLRREGSVRSLSSAADSYSSSSNSSKKSSRVLSIGLSVEDIFRMSKLPTESKLKRTDSTVSDLFSPEQQYAEIVYIPAPPEQSKGHDSDSSISTIVGGDEQPVEVQVQQASVTTDNNITAQASINTDNNITAQASINTDNNTTAPIVPEIVIISEASGQDRDKASVTFSESTKTCIVLPENPNLPRRYRDTGDSLKPSTSNPPKRSSSFLQRIKLRRGTSFKIERRPKKRVPVRRSFSDRIMYQIKKGQIEYKQDLNFISNPSHLRRIGRMIDKLAGRLHLVQLHRPPNGRYGIYITQSAARKGIFVSRFADDNTAKFYSGLIAPGDEIIKINKDRVKEKTVDYVYDAMAKLNSVVFTILPVHSRPDW